MSDLEGHGPVQVVVGWAGERPTTEEVQALRRLVPSLAQQKVSDVLLEMAGRPRWSLGVHPGPAAERIARDAERLGLSVSLEPAETELPTPSAFDQPALRIGSMPVPLPYLVIGGLLLVSLLLWSWIG